jgi:hypothetical protein
MSRAKRAIPRQHRSILLTVGITAGVVIAGVFAAAQFRSDAGPGANPAPITTGASGEAGPVASGAPSVTVSQTPTVTPSEQRASTTGPGTDAVRACSSEITATEAVVGAARVAATHWREHVQARTDLLATKNTEATTKAIWKRTRLAGPADAANLSAATTAQLQTQGGCTKLAGAAAPACQRRMAALHAAASTGRAAAGDWANHLAMMAAHAAGDFGADHAQHLWVAAWTAAPKNLDAFARADAALTKAPSCKPA